MAEASYEFVESGIVLNTTDMEAYKKVLYAPDAWVHHGEAWAFLTEYHDDFAKFPSTEVLLSKFPALDKTAKGSADFDWFVAQFNKQQQYRAIARTYQDNQKVIREAPEAAIIKLINELEGITSAYDRDIYIYDAGTLDRLEIYKERAAQRAKLGIIGIPTPLKTINARGVGFVPGELTSVYARPTVGKSWLLLDAAAIAAHKGYKVLFVTVEMPALQMSMRLDVVMAARYKDEKGKRRFNFSHKQLRSGHPDFNVKQYEEFLKLSCNKNVIMTGQMNNKTITVEGVDSIVKKHKPDFVIIDGIYLLRSEGRSAKWEVNDDMFSGLKNIAINRGVPVLVSTQANRNAANIFEPPTAAEVAYGDALVRFSDMAFSMSKVEDNYMQRIVTLQKIRDDEFETTPTALMHWDVDTGDIKEISP